MPFYCAQVEIQSVGMNTVIVFVVRYFQTLFNINVIVIRLWGHAVAWLVQGLRWKPEGRGFNSDEVIGFFN
jgi:hypothetical protein